MSFLSLMVGLAVVGLVIVGFIAYWVVMIGLIILGVLFLFWYWLFIYFFDGQFIIVPCAVIATLLTLWMFGVYGEKRDKKKTIGGS